MVQQPFHSLKNLAQLICYLIKHCEMASPTRWTWVWMNSGSWWWTGRPGVLRFMGSRRVGYDWATELNWNQLVNRLCIFTLKNFFFMLCNVGPLGEARWPWGGQEKQHNDFSFSSLCGPACQEEQGQPHQVAAGWEVHGGRRKTAEVRTEDAKPRVRGWESRIGKG